MLFDFFFYTILISTTFISYKIIGSTSVSNKFIKSFNALFILFCGSLWLWQCLIWTLPKGSKFQEAVRLPRHLWMLDYAKFKDGEGRQKINYGTNDRQYYQYYPAPKGSNKRNTVIFYLHGGGWCLGSPHQHQHLAHLLQQQGYTLIFPAYRLTPNFGYYELQEDVNSAFKHSIDFLKTQGINNPKLIIGGTSAGGNLASLLAYDEERWDRLGIDRSILQGVFSLVGALDITKMEQTFTLLDYTGQPNDTTYALANPISWISPEDTFKFLCIHGKKDGLVNYAAAASFCKKLSFQVPNVLDFRTFDHATHIDLGAAWYYNDQVNYGQDTILTNWLHKVTQPVSTSPNLL